MPRRMSQIQRANQTALSSISVSLSAHALSEMIERRAYELYELRGAGEGDSLSDWLKAEQDIVLMLLSDPRAGVEPERRPPASSRIDARPSTPANVSRRSPKLKNELKFNPA